MRKFYQYLLIGLLVLGPGLALSGEIGIIQVSNLNMRNGPGIHYKSIFQLAEGMQVRILARDKGWLKIERNGIVGYVRNRSRFIQIASIDESGSTEDIAVGQVKLKNLQQEAESIQGKMQASQQALADMDREEKSVLQELNEIDRSLTDARAQIRSVRAGIADLEEEMKGINRKSADLQTQIKTNEAYASQRLVALYKLNWIGRIQLLATAESFFDFLDRRSALQNILKQDERLLEKLNQDKIDLESLLEQLQLRKTEKRALELTLKKQIRTLDAEQDKRAGLLRTIKNEKSTAMATLDELKHAAQELDSTLRNLPAARNRIESKETDQDADQAFERYKGLLSWPVKGKIVSFYGPYRDDRYNVTNFESGINIQAERGEPIRAVADGYTIFASWFKGYGNMVIIDHGDHYYTVYAHLEEVFKVKGDRVDKGEVIATVGDSGSLSGPGLHFEVRHHGKPTDPLQWIKKG